MRIRSPIRSAAWIAGTARSMSPPCAAAAPANCSGPIAHGDSRRALRRRNQSLAALPDLRPLGQIHESFIIAAGPRRPVDHRPARGARAHPVRAGAEAARRRPRGDAAAADAADRCSSRRSSRSITPASPTSCTPRASRPSRSAIARSRSRPRPPAVGPRRPGAAPVRDSGDRRGRTARRSLDDLRRNICASIACRAAIKINMRLDAGQDGVAAARALADRLPDELPARPADRAALLDARDSEELSPDLVADCADGLLGKLAWPAALFALCEEILHPGQIRVDDGRQV